MGFLSTTRESKIASHVHVYSFSSVINLLLAGIFKDKPDQRCPRSKPKSRLEEAALDEAVFGGPGSLPAFSERTLLSGLFALTAITCFL